MSELKKKTGKKFRTNVGDLRGKPDIVFQKEKVCVFLDSDFWHGWQYPRWKKVLKNDFDRLESERIGPKLRAGYVALVDRLLLAYPAPELARPSGGMCH